VPDFSTPCYGTDQDHTGAYVNPFDPPETGCPVKSRVFGGSGRQVIIF
jgi:hypothetical protein